MLVRAMQFGAKSHVRQASAGPTNRIFRFISAPGRATYGGMSIFALAALARRDLSRYADDRERKLERRFFVTSFLRKVGLIGAVFFAANALAAIASLVILFMRRRAQAALTSSRTCTVCNASLATAAKYCHQCGSRT